MSGNMFSADAINKAVKENVEEQKKLKQKQLPMGFHILELVSVKLEKSKDQDPMFVLTIRKADDKKEEFRTISEYLVIKENGLTTKSGVNFNVYIMLTFFVNSFKFTPKEPGSDDPYGDIEQQFKTCEGKTFRGVINHKMELNSKSTKATPRAHLEFRKCTDIADMTLNEKSVGDPKALFTDLSPKEKAILKGEAQPAAKYSGTSNDTHGVPTVSDNDVDDLPF